MHRARVEQICSELLGEFARGMELQHTAKTSERMARTLEFLTSGYGEDPERIAHEAVLPSASREMVIVRDIELYSLCEHHMLPFFGRAHVGYLPGRLLLGVSKVARVVDTYARRLQIQERLTDEIAGTLVRGIQPRGLGVVIVARHLCMMMRGVEKQNSEMVSSCMLGRFRESFTTRSEFLRLVGFES